MDKKREDRCLLSGPPIISIDVDHGSKDGDP
jgi:hypothetical protein